MPDGKARKHPLECLQPQHEATAASAKQLDNGSQIAAADLQNMLPWVRLLQAGGFQKLAAADQDHVQSKQSYPRLRWLLVWSLANETSEADLHSFTQARHLLDCCGLIGAAICSILQMLSWAEINNNVQGLMLTCRLDWFNNPTCLIGRRKK